MDSRGIKMSSRGTRCGEKEEKEIQRTWLIHSLDKWHSQVVTRPPFHELIFQIK